MDVEKKKKLRIEYKNMRAQIPVDEKNKSDLIITRGLLDTEVYAQSQQILCYVSAENEIDTRRIISDALEKGKKVFVPKCGEEKGIMRFYRIFSFDDLKTGKYGIEEPVNLTTEWEPSDEKAVCIVPTLCCDRFGNRLGYGGGYYDRFLRQFNGKTVCLCYARFSDADLPLEQHDVPCDIVVKG